MSQLYRHLIDDVIAKAHERGIVINEIRLDTTTYEEVIDSAVSHKTISREVGGPVKYDGFTLRPCGGCGDLSIKVIAKR